MAFKIGQLTDVSPGNLHQYLSSNRHYQRQQLAGSSPGLGRAV